MSNSQRNILIIGGNSGIGLALIKKLHAEGCDLTVAARSPGNLESDLGLSVQKFEAEDREPKLDLPEALDGMVYLPGTINLKPFSRLTGDDFANEFEVNFFGAIRTLQLALPRLKKTEQTSSSIVLFSTVAASVGFPFHAGIASAKGALEGLALSLAAEYAPKIRFNVIAPSLTDTPLASSKTENEQMRESIAERHPLKRIGDAGEVAELASYLLSEQAGFISGQVIRADGGIAALRSA